MNRADIQRAREFVDEVARTGALGISPSALADRLHKNVEDATAVLFHLDQAEGLVRVQGFIRCPECGNVIELRGRTPGALNREAREQAGHGCSMCGVPLPDAQHIEIRLSFFFRKARPDPRDQDADRREGWDRP